MRPGIAVALLAAVCAVQPTLPARSDLPLEDDVLGRQAAAGESILRLPCDVRRRAAAAGGRSTAPVPMLTVTLPGLLANLMFGVAALEGISDSLQRVPHLSIDASCLLNGDAKADELSVRRVQAFAAAFGINLCEGMWQNASWHDAKQALGWGRYDGQLLLLNQHMEESRSKRDPEDSSADLARVAASFSPRYFNHLGRDYFRRLFTFPAHVMEKARNFITEARARDSEQDASRGLRLRLVGIHVRRGDKNWEFHMFNEWSHGASYIQRALDVSAKIYGGGGQAPLLYVVTTDDPRWVRATMGSIPNLVISPFATSPECKMDINCHEPLIDMAILSLCDAVVVSGSSTYSWWAGYLSAESSVVIAPRLPVNPLGEFGPCVTENPPVATLPLDHICSAGVDGVSSGAGEPVEAWCKWVPGGQRHARCGAFWSEEYYPEDWILLDEDPALDVYPNWWGPLVTSVQLVHDLDFNIHTAESACKQADGPNCREFATADGDKGQDREATRGFGRYRRVTLAARVLHAPDEATVCAYLHGSLLASLPAHGSGDALVQASLDAGLWDEHTALVCVAGGSACQQHPHLDPECLPSAFSLVLSGSFSKTLEEKRLRDCQESGAIAGTTILKNKK